MPTLRTPRRRTSTVFLLTLLALGSAPGPAAGRAGEAPGPALTVIDDGRTAGYLTLGWREAAGDRFEVQQRAAGAWRSIYRGPDRATTLTGLDDGDYAFRVRPLAPEGAWGPSLEVTVAHHSLHRALAFFGTGAAMFAVLVAALAWPLREEDGA